MHGAGSVNNCETELSVKVTTTLNMYFFYFLLGL